MRLLAATDFSDFAGLALDRAVSLASLHPDASLTLMHVLAAEGLEVIRQMFSAEIEKMERALEADAADRLQALAAKCQQTLNRAVDTRLVHGRPGGEIVSAAAEGAYDLIVMGEQGRTPSPPPFLGGTIERVLKRTDRSVLAVRQPAAQPYRRVLVCVGPGAGSPTAAELAFLLNPGSDVILLHAFEAPFENKYFSAGATDAWLNDYRSQGKRVAERELAQLGSRLEAAGIATRRIAAHGPPIATILEHSRNLAADLIVVGKPVRSVLDDLFSADIARQVTVEAQVDVLVAAALPEL